MKAFALTAAVLSTLPVFSNAATSPEKAQAVRNALTNVDKINVLEDGDFVFDFKDTSLKATSGAGGKLVSANVGNFAALVGNGLALTVGRMEPCGANSPHTHPRATEILLLLNGAISAGFLAENGSRFVFNNVTELSAMVFPAGSIHFQMNYGCEPVQFVAALSNEDPGTVQVAQRFFGLTADVVGAALGGLGVQDVENLGSLIPDNMIAGTKECYQRSAAAKPSTGTPTPPSQDTMPTAPPSSSKVIDVIVGKDLKFTYTPEDIQANAGDTVRFHFASKNHTVTQSSFDDPCTPLAKSGAFDSDFRPFSTNATDAQLTFDVVVKDDKPIWFFCRQKTPDSDKNHCQAKDMNGAINASKNGDKTLAKFKERARGTASSTTSTQAPPSSTYAPEPTYSSPAGKVVDVIVGKDMKLTYTPDDITASVGDTVRFHFASKNHTVTRSSFDDPCMPLNQYGAFDSDFRPFSATATEEQLTFDVVVQDEKPIWFYCRQKAPDAPKSHCQQDMNGVINVPKSADKSLAKFRERAEK
ncbi:RmlC-like cupin [Auriculariales sp. MPI-PUGE-AT-0066]|nr:RmlC-like cupin [Auriculariales sp. MPI-PUGE-AT-0066]